MKTIWTDKQPFMKQTPPPLCCLLVALLFSCADVGAQTFKAIGQVVTPDPQAVALGMHWLAMVDAGNYRQSRGQMAARIQAGGAVHTEQFVAYLKVKRAPLGRPISRTLFRARFSRTLAGSPDGNYEFLDYRTSFERKKQAFESVTLTKESGHWQVSGYTFW